MTSLKSIAVVTASLLAPVHGIMGVALFLIFADLSAGMCAARKRGEPITSSGIRRTVTKIFVYELAIVTGFVIERFIVPGMVPISKIVGALIALSEAKSVFENLNFIHGGDVFKKVLSVLGSINDKKLTDFFGSSKKPNKRSKKS